MIRRRQSHDQLFCLPHRGLEPASHIIETDGAPGIPVCPSCLSVICLDAASLTVADLEDAQRIAAGVA